MPHLPAEYRIDEGTANHEDLMVVKDLAENTVVKMKWVPTTHMLTDILTKRCE